MGCISNKTQMKMLSLDCHLFWSNKEILAKISFAGMVLCGGLSAMLLYHKACTVWFSCPGVVFCTQEKKTGCCRGLHNKDCQIFLKSTIYNLTIPALKAMLQINAFAPVQVCGVHLVQDYLM